MASTGLVVIIIGCFLHLYNCKQTQETIGNKHENSPYQRLVHHQAISNQRSTHISPPQPSVSSRGALILPANNQILANNFNSNLLNHPTSRYQQLATTITTTTTTQPTIVKSSRLQRVSNVSSNIGQPAAAVNTGNNYLQAGTIELALRQTSSDENVFQPSPTHDFNWLAHSTSQTQQQHQQNQQILNDPQVGSEGYDHGAHLSQSPYQSSITSTTTDQSNNLVQNDPIVSVGQQQEVQLEHQLQYGQHRFNHQQSEYPSSMAGNLTGIELNNHFNYKNSSPATVSSGDYYFSSAERLPNYERASNAWW